MNLVEMLSCWMERERERQREKRKTKTKISCEEGPRVAHLLLPSKDKEVREESEKMSKGSRCAILASDRDEVFNRRA